MASVLQSETWPSLVTVSAGPNALDGDQLLFFVFCLFFSCPVWPPQNNQIEGKVGLNNQWTALTHSLCVKTVFYTRLAHNKLKCDY